MNALNMVKTAYTTAQSPIRTPRSTEYEAFAHITHRLKDASKKGRGSFASLAEAIHANRRLWTLLAGDVADSGNGLPRQLRAQIFYLAEFTNHHSTLVLTGKGDVDVLVEINTSIMRGLRSQAGVL